jgi:hypothetical protein
MDVRDKGLVSYINERFLAELSKEPGIDLRLVTELTQMVADGDLGTETLLLELYQRLAADQS